MQSTKTRTLRRVATAIACTVLAEHADDAACVPEPQIYALPLAGLPS